MKLRISTKKKHEHHDISFYQLFRNFDTLITGDALKSYWFVLEAHVGNPDFGYFELEVELLSHFKTAEADYEINAK